MATTTTKPESKPPHIALFPCAGMGHLIPFLRLAAMLDSRGCTVTFITVQPTVTAAESDHLSDFFTLYPHIRRLEFQLLPYKKSKFTNEDPFFIQMESICSSVHVLYPLLQSLSPSLSAIIADLPVTSRIIHLASDLSISIYILTTTSARFFSVMNHLPQLADNNNNTRCNNGHIEIPGLGPMDVSNIPPAMLNPDHFFAVGITSNVSSLSKVNGILINTFTSFEPEAIDALKNNSGIAPILPIGPFECFNTPKAPNNLEWLDEQRPESVLFISFGSRTALSKDQITELANGLEKSRCKFLWALKGSKVDKEDKEKIENILGKSFIDRTMNQGKVVKEWVNQEQILAHPSVGGFLSHCGWNSVIEAAKLGVPILAWPQHGDQKVNAEVVENGGLGTWIRDWGWGTEKMVDSNEIAEKIKEFMVGGNLRVRAKEMKVKAQEAREINGSSEGLLRRMLESLKNKEED
ncbi:UDP-glucuronosyl and UDP-glucosyl transferase [Handroanthus impetiginosus]|uniref:Glycosyltransferase n=1 Tax=Handroanthus impetiginosus TaxID=429701 RepID=A0A2G9G5G4_9LAMI|nr:UDP-glucuronosyl and UDP-glucosyl transferase [Handroanthus impetiginosus]